MWCQQEKCVTPEIFYPGPRLEHKATPGSRLKTCRDDNVLVSWGFFYETGVGASFEAEDAAGFSSGVGL
jgi:hypothetical protein